MIGDLDNPPFVLCERRDNPRLTVIVGLLLALAGIAVQGRHDMIDAWLPAEWVLIPTGVAWAGFGAVNRLRPRTLILDPDAVTFRGLLATRRVPWPEVREVGLWSYRRRRSGPEFTGVRIQVWSGAPLNLPSGWGLATPALARTIQEARRRWAEPAATGVQDDLI